jgi:hypothetical protein
MPSIEPENKRLLTVEDTFQITGRGLVVVPGPPFDTFGTDGRTYPCSVLVKRPDGSTLVAQAHFYMAFFEPLEAQMRYLERGRYECVLRGVSKHDVPVGSEIYEVRTS